MKFGAFDFTNWLMNHARIISISIKLLGVTITSNVKKNKTVYFGPGFVVLVYWLSFAAKCKHDVTRAILKL